MPIGVYQHKKGWKHTEKAKRKVSLANKGKSKPIRSEEHRRNLSLALKGNKNSLGRKQTEETKKKISLAHIGKKFSEEHKRKLGLVNLGKKLSEEHKRKISMANTGRKMSEKTKDILRKVGFQKGHKVSQELREKLRKMMKDKPLHPTLIANFKKGRKLSKETKQKMSETAIRNVESGVHHLWKGGISFEPYSIDWKETLKRAIRERDHYLCAICKMYGNHVHHINYDKKNCNSDNLITLCNSCHGKTHHNRSYWMDYFKRNVKAG